jgi:hypothetical protein
MDWNQPAQDGSSVPSIKQDFFHYSFLQMTQV